MVMCHILPQLLVELYKDLFWLPYCSLCSLMIHHQLCPALFMFADDAKIFRVIKNKSEALPSDLYALHAWSVTWQL